MMIATGHARYRVHVIIISILNVICFFKSLRGAQLGFAINAVVPIIVRGTTAAVLLSSARNYTRKNL